MKAQIKIEIADSNSLAQYGPATYQEPVVEKKTALSFYNALMNNDMNAIKEASLFYYDLFNNEDLVDIKYYGALYWLSHCITANKEDFAKEMKDPLSEDLFVYFTQNNYEKLKDYLGLHYGFFDYASKRNKSNIGFYEDFMALNSPTRETWDSISKIMSCLPLKGGDKVIDMGCGLGYFSLKLAKIVGDSGKVYATDIENLYIEHLKKIMGKTGIKNVFPLVTSPEYIGVSDSVDAIFNSSLYGELYSCMPPFEMATLISSMKNTLKTNGYLIIIDNLKGRNRFVDTRLIITQLAYWGFSCIDYKSFTPQRFVLIFKKTDEKVKEQTLYANTKNPENSFLLNVSSGKTLFKFFDINSNNYIQKDKQEAAQMAYAFFETGNIALAAKAINMFEKIIPCENYDDVYSVLKWLCEVKSSSDKNRALILGKDTLTAVFYKTLTNNNDSLIKFYLKNKFKLIVADTNTMAEGSGTSLKSPQMISLEDYIMAFNPAVEKSNLIIENTHLRKDQVVAMLGNVQGFFSYRFSQIVGEKGQVYAIESIPRPHSTFKDFIDEQHIHNIDIIKYTSDTFTLKKKADVFFVFLFYPTIYSFSDIRRDKYIKSIKENLNNDGKFIVVDSDLSDEDNRHYKGTYLNKKLIEYQLAFYGFELESDLQINALQYMLTFKLKKN